MRSSPSPALKNEGGMKNDLRRFVQILFEPFGGGGTFLFL
jgi:hypothetical protein